jgi:hypothetical protein
MYSPIPRKYRITDTNYHLEVLLLLPVWETGSVSLSPSPCAHHILPCSAKMNSGWNLHLVRLLVVRHLEMLFTSVDLKDLWVFLGVRCELRASPWLSSTTWATSLVPFYVSDIFKIGSHELFVWGWLWTSVLLISASRVSGSHWRPPSTYYWVNFNESYFPLEYLLLERCTQWDLHALLSGGGGGFSQSLACAQHPTLPLSYTLCPRNYFLIYF